MTSFSMKPNSGGSSSESSIPNEDWDVWNDYVAGLIEAKEVEIEPGKFKKTKTYAGILNLIVEAGYQPQEDAEYDTKFKVPVGEEENSEEELEHIKKYSNNYFKWVNDNKGVQKRKQCRPQNPEQEVILCIDLPKIMIDYSKHPSSDSESPDLKPLRVSLNGRYKDTFYRHIVLRLDRDKKLSEKNMLYKIANKAGVLQEFIDSEYDLGVLAGATCNWSLEYSKNHSGERTFHNIQLKDPVAIEEIEAGDQKITVAQQIPKCDVSFVGILLNGGDYSEGVLLNLRKEFLNVMKKCVSFKPSPVKFPEFTLGCNWEDTSLCKALKVSENSNDNKNKKDKEGDKQPVLDKNMQEDDGLDDDIPF